MWLVLERGKGLAGMPGRGVTLDLAGDLVHRPDCLDRVLADRGLRGQHDRVGAVEDGIGHIRGLGAGGTRRGNHRFQHLGGGDHRLAVPVRRADQPLLGQGNLLEGQLDPEVAPGHHDRIGGLQDLLDVRQGGVLLDLGDELDRLGHQATEFAQVVSPAHKGERDVVNAQRDGTQHLFAVPVGDRRGGDLDPRQVHPLARLQGAAMDHGTLHPVAVHGGHLDLEQPVVEQDHRTRPHVARQGIVGRRDLVTAGAEFRRKHDGVADGQLHGTGQRANPDPWPLQVHQNGRTGGPLGLDGLEHPDPLDAGLRRAVGRVDTDDVDAGIEQLVHAGRRGPGGAEGGNNLGTAHIGRQSRRFSS